MYEVIIIGGGIMGLSTAFRLALEDNNILVIEKSTVGFEASSRNAGGVRQQFRDPRETQLAKFSVEVWQQLDRELSTELEYRQGGSLRIAIRDDEIAELHNVYERDRASGLPVQLLEPTEVANFIPIEKQAFKLAAFCPSDGQANPKLTCKAFADAAIREGATILEGQKVTSIAKNKARFTVQTNDCEYEAKKVVVAAGPWSSELVSPFAALKLIPRKPEMAETEPLEHFLDPFISLGDLKGYGRQTANGCLHFGVRSIDAAIDEPESSHERVKSAFSSWVGLFPHLEGAKIVRTWDGYTTWTPDLSPIIGALPNEPNFFVCTGFSGHGFALGPAVGIIMTELIKNRPLSVPIKGLEPDRFL